MIALTRTFTIGVAMIVLAIGIAATPLVARGDEEDTTSSLAFTPHILAYAQQHAAATAVDPHVFVQDANAPDTTGPENIHHLNGLRPARLADIRTLPLYDAQGDPLSLNLGHWLSSKGSAQVIHDSDGVRVHLAFTHLIPFGVYSIFSCKNAAGGYDMSPLHEDSGPTIFTADGDGALRLTLPLDHELRSSESLLLIYHSDNLDHSDQAGEFGTNAHVQLVLVKHEADSTPTAEPPAATPGDTTPL